MVIGHGLVAKAFESYKSSGDIVIFASGVSNSKFGLPQDYNREKSLLTATLKTYKDKTIVYFSTSSILDPDLSGTHYISHKIEMEDLIRQDASVFHIFRLSNLAGFSNNKNTLLNFFNFQIVNDLTFEYWTGAERNIIDIEDVYDIINYILEQGILRNQTVNVANPVNYTVPYILHCFESYYHKKAFALEKDKGVPFQIDISDIKPVIALLGIRFGDNYLPELLKKYYS